MKQEIIRIDLDGVNSYLVKSGENFILIDTGGHTIMDRQFTNRRELLQKALDKAGCSSENIKLLILTHGDNDHTANAVYIRDKYKTKIAMHPGDLPLVENPSLEKLMESYNYRSLIFKIIFKIMKKKIEPITLKILNDFEKFTPDILIDENFRLSDYNFDAEILNIPGHTIGSIGVLLENKDLIAGDIFVNSNKPEIAPNASDFKLLKKNIFKLKSLGIKTVYPGHGSPFEFRLI
jgi:hydroxyacylglutathione hydrolase